MGTHSYGSAIAFLSIAAMTTAILAAAAAGGGPTRTTTPAATTAPAMDPFLQALQTRLNSTDPTERSAAQKEMTAIAEIWQHPEMLDKLAAATSDPELRGLFQQRANLLRARTAEKDAMNLPPISLTLHNAGFPELAAALNTALDTALFQSNTNGTPGNFTIDAQNKPFWEVFRTLQEQQPFSAQNSNGGLSLYGNPLGIHNFAVSGPAMLYAMNVGYRRTVNLQTDAPPNIGVTLSLGLMVDPRVVAERFTNFSITKAADELGHNLLQQPMNTNGIFVQSNTTNLGFGLPALVGMGKRLALTADARIAIQTSFIEVAQDDVEHNLNKDMVLGNRIIRISAFTTSPNLIRVQWNVSRSAAATITLQDANAIIQYRALDANGKLVWSYSIPGNSGGVAAPLAPGSVAPYRLVARMTDKTQDINVHFDLQDIPLP